MNTATWFALGDAEAGRRQTYRHLYRYFNWMGEAREPMAQRFGFVGQASELRDMLKRMEDLGTDEFLLIPTSLDPNEVSRVAEALAL